MGRNFGFIKAEEHDKDVKSAFSMGFWTSFGLTSFGWVVVIMGTLFYLGAFH